MPINLKRSESLKSERSDASQKRVSFNKSVHVKHIPRGAVLDSRGRIVAVIPEGVDTEQYFRVAKAEPNLSPEEVVKEAAEVLRQVDKVTCSTSPTPFIARVSPDEDSGPKRPNKTSKMAQVIRPSDGYRRATTSRNLAGLKPATSSLNQGFTSSNRLRSRSEETSQAMNNQYHHQQQQHPYDEPDGRGRSSSPPPYHKMKPAAHVNALVQRFNDQARRRRVIDANVSGHTKSPERLMMTAGSRTHNANQPFSYLAAPSSPTLAPAAPPPPVLPPSLSSPHSSNSSQPRQMGDDSPSSAGSRESPDPIAQNLRAPHEVIYAQVAVNGRNKKTTIHRRLDAGTGTDSQEESVRMGPRNTDVSHKYHLNDHPTYNEIKVAEKHRGSADWSEDYHQHQQGRSRDSSPRAPPPAVFAIKSTSRSGEFRTAQDAYSRESSPESAFIQPRPTASYNNRYMKSHQEEEKWKTSNARDLDEIRGAGDGMEWKRIEYEKPVMESNKRMAGKNVSRVMLGDSSLEMEVQPTAPARAKNSRHQVQQHQDKYYYGAPATMTKAGQPQQRYYNTMARERSPPKLPPASQNSKYASVGRRMSASTTQQPQQVRRDIRYVERDDPPPRPSYPPVDQRNKEVARKPSLKKERSSMFNTLERLKGKLRKPLSELRADLKHKSHPQTAPPPVKGNALTSTELVRKADARDARLPVKTGPVPTGPPSTRESMSGLSKKSRKVKITFEHNPTRTDSDIENLRGFEQYKGPEIKGDGHVVKIEIKGDSLAPVREANYPPAPSRHHRETRRDQAHQNHYHASHSQSPVRSQVQPPAGDSKLLRSREKFLSAFLGPSPRSKSHERYATPTRKVVGPKAHHQSPHRVPEGQATQVPSSYEEDDDVRHAYAKPKTYGQPVGAPTDSDDCEPVDPRMKPGSSATLRTTRRPSYGGKTAGNSGSSPSRVQVIHANTVDYRRGPPGRDKNAVYQPWTMGRVKTSTSTRNLAADTGRSMHYASNAVDNQRHADYNKRQVTGESSSASERSNRGGNRRETRLKRSTSSAASLAFSNHGGSRHQLYQKPQPVHVSSESEAGGHGPGSQASRPSGSQSSRSVYLHAAAVADIPPGGALRGPAARSGRSSSLSQEDLLSKPGSLKRSRAVTRSLSLLAPWRPRHHKEEMEVEYNYDSQGQTPGNGRPPRPPRRKNSPGTQEPAKTFSAKVQRHQSMPKDSKLAGWFKKKQQPGAPANPAYAHPQHR